MTDQPATPSGTGQPSKKARASTHWGAIIAVAGTLLGACIGAAGGYATSAYEASVASAKDRHEQRRVACVSSGEAMVALATSQVNTFRLFFVEMDAEAADRSVDGLRAAGARLAITAPALMIAVPAKTMSAINRFVDHADAAFIGLIRAIAERRKVDSPRWERQAKDFLDEYRKMRAAQNDFFDACRTATKN
jgi:hypothetical protein